ncbi:hypothetical protein BFJ69_g16712 [Fusarium oxysporum]|uniref:5'-deoxynucleotidase n=1 Tax=Fusarium oxysporum TaxID=5507 RepID=A0A420MAE2_FUSOX|nr:hypothetical protein BFJ69_g16712 [Fusarium oxysporum]
MRSLVWLKEWAKEITYRPPIDQDSAIMTDPESTEWSLHGELLKRVHLQHPGDSKSLPVFARTVAHLLTVKRQGWLDNGIDETVVESVADHSWSMAVLCFLLREDGDVNIQDAVRGCVVHDLAESLVGDITYKDGVGREEKLQRERDTLAFLQFQLLDDAPLMSSWDEFETAETPTGGIAKDLDKVDLAFQALDYEERMKVQLPEFFHSARRVKFCGGLIEEILKTRMIGASAELDPKKRRKLDNYYGN